MAANGAPQRCRLSTHFCTPAALSRLLRRLPDSHLVSLEQAACRTSSPPMPLPPEVKHWHGAKADSWFSHSAGEVPGETTRNEWCEPVTDEEYAKLK